MCTALHEEWGGDILTHSLDDCTKYLFYIIQWKSEWARWMHGCKSPNICSLWFIYIYIYSAYKNKSPQRNTQMDMTLWDKP